MSRSYLFIPGNTPNMVQNLDIFESDAVIIDFEDSVMSYDKDAARILIQNFLQKFPLQEGTIYIRINDVENSHFEADILATRDLKIAGYVLPKASVEAIDKLNQLSSGLSIIPIIESPIALLESKQIATSKNVIGLLFGAEDYTKEMGIERTLEAKELLYPRSHIAVVCRAYNIEAIDTPYTAKDDDAGLQQDAMNAKALGFTAKALIHPNQVDTINRIFAPSPEEILQAKRILKKSEELQKGAFSLDGKMIDLPIIEKAKKVLEKAQKYGL
ncbi:MAG: CoA ester lyase [Firmicutes bacterium]|nr:CoA ester lyase [Bacillota bacterium]